MLSYAFCGCSELTNITIPDSVTDIRDSTFAGCRSLSSIKLPSAAKDRGILGFSNTTQSSIVCFYEGGKVTYFSSQWKFDYDQKMWNILYTEQDWKDAPTGKPHFKNNIDSFKSSLSQIKELACKIDCDEFATIFQKALDILSGSSDYTGTAFQMPLQEIPKKTCIFLRRLVLLLFLAQWVLGVRVIFEQEQIYSILTEQYFEE